jgi:radical SAM-linked protein
MKFNKSGRIRFLSHLDFMTLFHRCASRAGIPLAFSQGFNPHPKISFGPPLAVGMESEAEYVDLETDPLIDLLSVTKDLNAVLPEGVRILESRIIPKKAPSLSGGIGRYAYEIMVPAEHAADMERLVREFLARSAVIVMRDGREKDIRQGIESIVIGPANDAGRLDMILRDSEQVKPRPQDVIEQLFGISREQAALFSVRRVAMYCKDDRGWHSPMDIA